MDAVEFFGFSMVFLGLLGIIFAWYINRNPKKKDE